MENILPSCTAEHLKNETVAALKVKAQKSAAMQEHKKAKQ